MPLDCAIPVAEVADLSLEAGTRRLREAKLKRVVDVCGAGFGLMLLLPFLLLVALIIVLESPGPALFRQRRTGYNGKTFVIYKFRSMCVQEDGAGVKQASKGDKRITPFGAFMRRASIDELPQLINVLKGEMSLVGPRPHALAHDEYYGALVKGYWDRFRAKPGLTGLAQVCGLRGETQAIERMAARVQQDVEYIRTWSLLLDIKILLRTLMIGPFDPAAY